MTASIVSLPARKRVGPAPSQENARRTADIIPFRRGEENIARVEAYIREHFDFIPAARRTALAQQIHELESGKRIATSGYDSARLLRAHMRNQAQAT